MLRQRLEASVAQIQGTPWARLEDQQAFEPCEDEMEAARQLFLRCWMSDMGATDRSTGWRANARTKNGHIPFRGWEKRLLVVAKRMRQAQIECGEALKVIRRFDGPEIRTSTPDYARIDSPPLQVQLVIEGGGSLQVNNLLVLRSQTSQILKDGA